MAVEEELSDFAAAEEPSDFDALSGLEAPDADVASDFALSDFAPSDFALSLFALSVFAPSEELVPPRLSLR